MLWQAEQLSKISAALDAARGGRPTVLGVLGEPGMGKTSLLREIAARSSGFNVLEADGRESAYREPFDLLRQFGVHDDLIDSGNFRDPLVATQGLRYLVDALSPSGPVLILVDDLQWADQESVESLYWLVHRAYGDRLLMVLGSRPEGPAGMDAWRRLVQQASRGPVLSLTGLSFEPVRPAPAGPGGLLTHLSASAPVVLAQRERWPPVGWRSGGELIGKQPCALALQLPMSARRLAHATTFVPGSRYNGCHG